MGLAAAPFAFTFLWRALDSLPISIPFLALASIPFLALAAVALGLALAKRVALASGLMAGLFVWAAFLAWLLNDVGSGMDF